MLAGLLLLAACGGATPSAARPTASLDARQVLLASVQTSSAQSFICDTTMDMTLSATGPQASKFATLSGKTIVMSVAMAAQSRQRIQLVVHETVAGAAIAVIVVVYDGVAYVSSNGGSTYKTVPSTGALAANGALPSQYASGNALAYLQSVGAVTDNGPGTADGVAVENYSAHFDGSKVLALIRSAFSSVQAPAQLQRVFAAITFKSGTLEVSLDHQGRVVTEQGPLDATLDLGSLSSSLAGTTLVVHEALDAHFHDYGGAVTVTKPAALATP